MARCTPLCDLVKTTLVITIIIIIIIIISNTEQEQLKKWVPTLVINMNCLLTFNFDQCGVNGLRLWPKTGFGLVAVKKKKKKQFFYFLVVVFFSFNSLDLILKFL
jgi:hypothetical protein